MRDQSFDWRPYIIEFHRQAPKLMRARAFVLGGVLQLRLVGSEGTLERSFVPCPAGAFQEAVDLQIRTAVRSMIAREDRPIMFAGVDLGYDGPVVVVPTERPQPKFKLRDRVAGVAAGNPRLQVAGQIESILRLTDGRVQYIVNNELSASGRWWCFEDDLHPLAARSDLGDIQPILPDAAQRDRVEMIEAIRADLLARPDLAELLNKHAAQAGLSRCRG